MSKNMNPAAPTTSEREFHLVCSSGGSRAILGSAGVLLACALAGIKRFKSIGGISGGSIPTVLFASGLSAAACVLKALEIDFSSLLTRHASFLRILFAYFMQRPNEKVRPVRGVMTSEKLGAFVESHATKMANGHLWVPGYWTQSIAEDAAIVFCENGVFEIKPDDQLRVLSSEPCPLGIAVRGSCAVPGIISAVEWKGKMLFDGVLGPEGRVPASIPMRLFGAKPTDIIAVDVGDEGGKHNEHMTKLWTWVCGDNCVPHVDEPPYNEEHGVIFIEPHITSVRSLKFTLTKDQKWQAVMAGFAAAVHELALARVLVGDGLAKAKEILSAYDNLLAKHAKDSEAPLRRLLSRFRLDNLLAKDSEGTLSHLIEELLAKHGLI